MNQHVAHAIGRLKSDGLRTFTGNLTRVIKGKWSVTSARARNRRWAVKKTIRGHIATWLGASPALRRKWPESAGIARGVALMCRGEWRSALDVWDGLLAVLVGERLQVPRAGRVVCGWLTDPVGFRSELAVAQRLVAGPGVVTDTVVCSAVVGGHDVSWPAGGVVPGASYVRFTDDPGLETWGVWSNRPLEFFGGTAVRSARWVKTHPHMLFPDARWVVWVDGNVIPLTGVVRGVQSVWCSCGGDFASDEVDGDRGDCGVCASGEGFG